MTCVDRVVAEVPASIEAQVTSVYDLYGESFAVGFGDLLTMDWDVEGAPPCLELSAGVVLRCCVVHELDLVIEVAGSEGVDLVEQGFQRFHSYLFIW